MADQDHGGLRLELKQLASQNNLNIDELKIIIAFCGNFFNQDLPQKFGKSFNLPFLIRGFGGKTFRLQKSNKIEAQLKLIADINQDKTISSEQKKKIIDELNRQKDKILQNSLFLSDFVAFLEQSSLQLAKFLNQNNKQELDKLGNDYFQRIGLGPKTGSGQISLKNLKTLEESPPLWQKVSGDLAQSLLNIIKQQEQKSTKEEEQDQQEEVIPPPVTGPSKTSQARKAPDDDQDKDGTELEDTQPVEKKETPPTLPEGFSEEFNLARLDSHSKLYIRSLAIISVNQALHLQFAKLSKEQLKEMGFDEIPNFNQLSLETRQVLLNVAFTKIENLFTSGAYDLKSLIENPSQRIVFAKDVAFKVMTDVRGGEIFAQELGKLTASDKSSTDVRGELEENQNQALDQDQLSDKLIIKDAVVPTNLKDQVKSLSSENAESFLAQLDSEKELQNSFFANIKRSFTKVTKNNFLNEWKRIVKDDKSALDRAFLVETNILPIIDVFIQQNYPVEYIERFDWARFQIHFGREVISQQSFLANQRAIIDLLGSYWRTQRAKWSLNIHEGISNELYTADQVDEIWQKTSEQKEAKVKKTLTTTSVKAPPVPMETTKTDLSKIQESAETKNQSELIRERQKKYLETLERQARGEEVDPDEYADYIFGQKLQIEEILSTDKKIRQKQATYLAQLKQQALFNTINADAVTQLFAGFPIDQIDFRLFKQGQKNKLFQINTTYQQTYIDTINQIGHQAQAATLFYYFPQKTYFTETISLQMNSLPQFSAYDLGMISFNQAFGPNEDGQYPMHKSLDQDGGIEGKLADGFEGVKNAAGKAVDFVGEKAVRAGLDYATGGAFETLPEPVKQMIEKIAWGEIKRKIEPLIKVFLILLTPLIAAALKILHVTGQALGFFRTGLIHSGTAIGARQTIFRDALPSVEASASVTQPETIAQAEAGTQNQLANRTMVAEQRALAQTEIGRLTTARPVLAEIGSNAMLTAGQAVFASFGLLATSLLAYRLVINSAFLTIFPDSTRQYGGGGSAIFCDDVIVGHLTYYSQKDYNDIMICGGGCTFGSSACGPVAIAMILNEDPVQMSIGEGYLVPGGCGMTSCGGTAASPLISTLKSRGISVSERFNISGSPGQITDEIAKYLAEGNVLFALGYVRGWGHYLIITCVEEPGFVVTYDPYWGQNAVHKVVSTADEGLMSGTNHLYIRDLWAVRN